MKQRQYITTFSLIVALTGLSPVVAAEAGKTPGDKQHQPVPPLGYKLTLEHMDKVSAGRISQVEKRRIINYANAIFMQCGGWPACISEWNAAVERASQYYDQSSKLD